MTAWRRSRDTPTTECAEFHPGGSLLASTSWEGRLRLWDTVLGRPVLSVTSAHEKVQFSRDGRIVVRREDQLTTYQVEPALEYRTLAYTSNEPVKFERVSIERHGSILAVGTKLGAVLWDLARGTEVAFLPIDLGGHLMFDPSGNLVTSGKMGLQRWPIHLDLSQNEFRIGPPKQLPSPAGGRAIDTDRSGRIIALADDDWAHVLTPLSRFWVGPLVDCRYIAVSPDGQW